MIHEITNDVTLSEQHALKCAHDMVQLAKVASEKSDNVIISLGLPRCDDEVKHELTQMINQEIDHVIKRHRVNAWPCYNDNLLYRGRANYKYFTRDGKHLTTAGKVVFSRNLTHTIHNVLGGNRNNYKESW